MNVLGRQRFFSPPPNFRPHNIQEFLGGAAFQNKKLGVQQMSLFEQQGRPVLETFPFTSPGDKRLPEAVIMPQGYLEGHLKDSSNVLRKDLASHNQQLLFFPKQLVLEVFSLTPPVICLSSDRQLKNHLDPSVCDTNPFQNGSKHSGDKLGRL